MSKGKIRVIDLFAGPGGLGEGFSAFRGKRNSRAFHLEMSVEKEASAHRTLELRAFFRQFDTPPPAYYEYIRGRLNRDDLFGRFPAKARRARRETLCGPRELGPGADDDAEIHERLQELKNDFEGPWVVLGGPPCQAYSLVGRARNKGIRGYKAENDKRHFLYEEYLKVLSAIRPEIFVMENVKGILSSKVSGKHIFPRLLDDLRCPDRAVGKKTGSNARYRVFSLVSGKEVDGLNESGAGCVIKAEHYGVPQSRHRVILLGVREDIDKNPETLFQDERVFTAHDVLSNLPRLRSGLSKGADSADSWKKLIASIAKKVAAELNTRGLDGTEAVKAAKEAASLCSRGEKFLPYSTSWDGPRHLAEWLPDNKLGGIVNHETRGHMEEDLSRYLYCSSFAAQKNGDSPRSSDFPSALAPRHKNWSSGKFADRFKVQALNKPASTITSHISKDGHYYIHYDPAQCRSLTVREAARLQTFPDNYFFEGNRTQQYVQVGNAVPPWLAGQIAGIVYNLLR